VAVVAVDGGEADDVLPRHPGPVHAHAVPAEAVLGLQRLLRLPGVLALEVGGVADLHHAVVDVEIRELLGLPLDDDGVVAGELQRGAEEPVGIGGGGSGKAEAKFDFRLVPAAGGSPKLQSSASAKEDTSDMSANAALQEEARAVAAAVGRE